MFKVITKHLFWWPVTVRMPDPSDAGKLTVQTFAMRFETLSRGRAQQLDEELSTLAEAERAARDVDLVMEISRDWRDVVDAEGQPVAFSADALKAQLAFPWFRLAVEEAYGQASRAEAPT